MCDTRHIQASGICYPIKTCVQVNAVIQFKHKLIIEKLYYGHNQQKWEGDAMRGKDSVVRMAHAGVLRNAEEKLV